MANVEVIEATVAGLKARIIEREFVDQVTVDQEHKYLVGFVAGMLAKGNDFTPPSLDEIYEAWTKFWGAVWS